MAAPGEDAYCTLVMSDSYLPGAVVLAHSLRDAGTTKKLAALITLDTVGADTITKLRELYDVLIPVDRIRNPNPANLFLMDRADLLFAFTKINLWRQIQFRKIVYLDADVVALRAPDELFDIEAPFAAAPDVGWPDAFNTGVMVLTPNMGDYWALQTMAASGDSFDGADQGLLNQYFEHRGWHRISFTYNCTPNAQYQWEPAYRHYKRDISMVHFIGKDKPWIRGRQSIGSGVYNELLGRWWATHDRHLKQPTPKLAATRDSSQPQTTEQHHAPAGDASHAEATPSLTTAAAASQPAGPIPQIIEPEATVITTEEPLSEPADHPESTQPSVTEQPPPPEARKFSAPTMEWDATRSAPPMESRPEAANFPVETYEFSESRSLFQAPQSYPEPPRDMWYQVPPSKPKAEEQPKPIFPWEMNRERPKPTRVFAEDLPPQPALVQEFPPPPTAQPFAEPFGQSSQSAEPAAKGVEGEASRESTPTPPPISWEEFSQRPNAWDEVPGIETYVRAILDQHTKRGRPVVLSQSGTAEAITSPKMSRQDRRESLILTDFPTAVERPSLPVTPAPIRRTKFWGEGEEGAEDLPAAEGVPDQAEWDPEARLDELRRSSLLEFEHLLSPDALQKKVPQREMPESAAPLPHENTDEFEQEAELSAPTNNAPAHSAPEESSAAEAAVTTTPANPMVVKHYEEGKGNGATPLPQAPPAAPVSREKPVFHEPDFSGGASGQTKAAAVSDVLSPGETEKEQTGLFTAEAADAAELVSPTDR